LSQAQRTSDVPAAQVFVDKGYLKGAPGDAINALLCAAAHNLRKILAKLRLLHVQWGLTCPQFPCHSFFQIAG
jgi:hypothetical protein